MKRSIIAGQERSYTGLWRKGGKGFELGGIFIKVLLISTMVVQVRKKQKKANKKQIERERPRDKQQTGKKRLTCVSRERSSGVLEGNYGICGLDRVREKEKGGIKKEKRGQSAEKREDMEC